MQCIDWAVGNGAPLCLKKDNNVEFDAKVDGANRFLKKGAQSAQFGPNRDQTDFEVILANFTRYQPWVQY